MLLVLPFQPFFHFLVRSWEAKVERQSFGWIQEKSSADFFSFSSFLIAVLSDLLGFYVII